MSTTTGRGHRALPALTALALMALGVSGCYDLGVGDGGTNPGAGTPGGSSRTYTVEYSALATGDGVLADIQYLDDQGQQVIVVDPVLPFSQSLTLSPGDDAGLSATGTVTSGTLDIRMVTTSSDGQGTVLDLGDGCGSAGTTITCELDLPAVTLQ
jgi:hypothetical protein